MSIATRHSRELSIAQDDWRLTVMATFGSMSINTSRERGMSIRDGARILNISPEQVGYALWAAARYSYFPIADVDGVDPIRPSKNSPDKEGFIPPRSIRLVLQVPALRDLSDARQKVLLPMHDRPGYWTVETAEPDKLKFAQKLDYHIRTLRSEACSSDPARNDIWAYCCYLDLGIFGPFDLQYLFPSSLAESGDLRLREAFGTSASKIAKAHPYGSVPASMVEGAIENDIKAAAAMAGNQLVRIISDDGGSYEATIEHVFNTDSRGHSCHLDSKGRNIVITRDRGGVRRVLDIHELGKDSRKVKFHIENANAKNDKQHDAEAMVPIDGEGAIDFWDIPVDGVYPDFEESENVKSDVELVFFELIRDDGSHGNVMHKIRELVGRDGFGHMGTLRYFDADGKEIQNPRDAVSARYRVDSVYTTGSFEKYILSWGSNCLVSSPKELQAWHIDGALDRLERFSKLQTGE